MHLRIRLSLCFFLKMAATEGRREDRGDIFLFCDVNIRKRLRGGFDLGSASYLREAGLGWLAGRSGLDALRSDGGAQAARSLGSTGYHDNNRRTEGLDQGSTERVARLQNDN